MWQSVPYRNAIELQRLIVQDARKDDLKPIIRAGLARAFCELEMLKLRLRMKPAPKPIDVQPKKAKVKPKSLVADDTTSSVQPQEPSAQE